MVVMDGDTVVDDDNGAEVSSPIVIPPLTTPPPLSTTLEPRELVFATSPSSPHPYLNILEDLPPRSTNPPPFPTFESMERVARQPPLLTDYMDVETSLPLLPPHLPPPNTFLPIDQSLWIDGPPPQPTRHEHLCDHCQRTHTLVHEVRDEMRFMFNDSLKCNTLKICRSGMVTGGITP
ncbi:hypothetical protein Tco_0764914 [Tanacetum coccineum]